ncbi:hypothetical protein Patl1_34390 [Pistacia atlantica]|uniref:Uncharacterized protein n=1 Tax=Pistacia atlantica TaxID=434234 RepID=A0ACC0ZPC2_9ROSI|nr:hypothetical protein Patl1_34390 [Pistacia atlantica]
MTMATLNILSPSPMTNSLFNITNYSRTYHNLYYNNINIKCKHFFYPNDTQFTVISSLFSQTKSNPSLKSSPMPTHFSKSGSGCSWLQENSMHEIDAAGTGRKQRRSCSAFPTKPAEISSVQDLFEFICSGPLIEKLGLTPEKIAESVDEWIAYNSYLSRLFQLNELYLTIPQKARFFHYYIPVFLWCEDQISQHRSKFKDGEDIPPLVVCVSVHLKVVERQHLFLLLIHLFQKTGRKSATLSIDDFYLTAEGQAKLREEHPGNALLEFRGNAGSHDLQLSIETLTAVSKLNKQGEMSCSVSCFCTLILIYFFDWFYWRHSGTKMKLPRYDKLLMIVVVLCSLLIMGGVIELILQHGQKVEGPLTTKSNTDSLYCVSFCLKVGCLVSNLFLQKLLKQLTHRLGLATYLLTLNGIAYALSLFHSIPLKKKKLLPMLLSQLEVVNKNLEAYYDAWDKFIKSWIVIKIKDPSCVYEWRLQAEIAMREAGNPGMSDEEVKDFVSRYLPAYNAYLPTLYSKDLMDQIQSICFLLKSMKGGIHFR